MIKQYKTLIIAETLNEGNLYLRKINADPGKHQVITDPERLRGIGPDRKVIVVTGRTEWLMKVTERLASAGCDQRYVDLDRLYGVSRDPEYVTILLTGGPHDGREFTVDMNTTESPETINLMADQPPDPDHWPDRLPFGTEVDQYRRPQTSAELLEAQNAFMRGRPVTYRHTGRTRI